MQKLQLYIEGERVDLFEDETVSITQTIQNIKDIDKVFTDFSKTFTLPASKKNNKIFKHYYNFNIDIDFGFDGRVKKSATIELNSIPFRQGKIKLEGVNLKNNKPNAYRITFFGNTVVLKDLFGEDSLSALPFADSNNEVYSPSRIQNALQLDPKTNDVIAPLITHTQRLFYDSSTGDSSKTAGNVFYHTQSSANAFHGVKWSDLKYAIRLDVIIKAIETRYGIVFSNDFFVNTNAPYYDLFIWLHRKKGDVESASGFNASVINGWVATSLGDTETQMASSSILRVQGNPLKYPSYSLTLSPNVSTAYSVSLQLNGIEVYNTGTVSNNVTINQSDFTIAQGDYTAFISSNADIAFSSIEWDINYRPTGAQFFSNTYTTTGTYQHNNVFNFNINQQIPEMKVIDLLTSVFKTFNLTAFVDKNTNEITVKTLNSFYSGGNSYDITKNIDSDSSSVDVALPYREINFEHGDTKTLLAKQHEQLFGKGWGKTEFTNNGEKLDGSIYNVKTGFSQLKNERLIDVNGASNTDIQYGFFVDDNQESYYGMPLLFYPVRQTSSTQISFLTNDTTKVPLTTYNVSSNSVSLSSSVSGANINFHAETNEYGGLEDPVDNGFTDSLFEVYYRNYITSVFNPANRLTKVTAYLPLRIFLNYTLADRFVISGNSYKINSITTNLQTGKSEIELLNDL